LKGISFMKKQILVLLMGWAIMPIFVHAAAHMRLGQPEVLKGLEAIRLEVERIKPEIERDGLFRETLYSDMELKLRLAGIKVLSDEQAEQRPEAPVLYLNVDALKCSFGYVYNIGLYLIEPATLVRKPIKAPAMFLRLPEQLGIASRLSEVREAAGDALDEFVKVWKESNSKP
jgi:hypothetical protein